MKELNKWKFAYNPTPKLLLFHLLLSTPVANEIISSLQADHLCKNIFLENNRENSKKPRNTWHEDPSGVNEVCDAE